MKQLSSICRIGFAVGFGTLATVNLIAQQPAVPAQAPGGRGGAPAAPALNPAQAAAMNQAAVPPALTTAATNAVTDLTRASLSQPANVGDITAKAGALGAAELALALSRADEFAKAQALLKPITSAQATAALGRAGGGGRGGPMMPDTNDGFTSIFNGRDLTGWDGDLKYWKVENGVIVAESTPENPVRSNTFLIWRDGIVKDFELKVDYRFIGNGNSGIQFRSRPSGPQGEDERKWGISGYQFDMVTAGGTGSGVFYGEGGGLGVTQQTALRSTPSGVRQIGSLGPGIGDAIKPGGEWNTYHIIVRQNVFAGFINGRMTAFMVDDNRSIALYAMEGLLALQMHTGQPFRLEFRNVLLKQVTPESLAKLDVAPAPQGRGGQ